MTTETRELTVRQAAKRAGVTTSYIRYLLKHKKIYGRQPDGWTWFVNRASLERWIAERKERKERA